MDFPAQMLLLKKVAIVIFLVMVYVFVNVFTCCCIFSSDLEGTVDIDSFVRMFEGVAVEDLLQLMR